MQPVLTIAGLRKSFGPVEALRQVDLTLHKGEVLALVGDNGAGKSTLIKHISGVYRPDAGQMTLEGQPLELTSPRQARERGIETVYQDLALADDLSIGANIFLGREPMRRVLGVLPVIDTRAIQAETAAFWTGWTAISRHEPAPWRACRAGRGRRWPLPGRSTGRPRSC
jgi:simple sugar transport system ATP-binding protein